MKRSPSFWRIQIAGWSFYGVVRFLAALPVVAPEDLGTMAVIQLIRALTGLGVSALLAPVLRRALPLRTGGVLAIAVLASAIASQLWFLVDRTGMVTVTSLLGLTVRWSWFPRGVELDYPFVLLVWSGAFLVVHYANEATERRRHALERDLALREAQLGLLHQQLRPHFLFNALNSLRSLIAEDSGRAREMVTRLSRFLGATLAADHATTLGEELETLRAYLAIQKVRFEDALEVEIVTDAEAEPCRVPALLLQPLVENAIKHGAVEPSTPLRIRVSTALRNERLEIVVANTGRLVSGGGGGIGLANTRARLEGFYGARSTFTLVPEGGWVRATITVMRPERIPCER